MKTSYWIILLPFLFSVPSYAVDNSVCDGVIPIVVDRNDRVRPMTPAKFQNLFTQNYQNYSCLNNSAYCLCFDYRTDFPTNALTLSLDSTVGNKPVYIVGLRINGLAGPLLIKGTQPVTLIDTSFTCTSKNTPSPQPSPTGGEGGSVGIQLNGDGHQIVGGTISNCAVGVQISGNDNQATLTTIRDNGIGIKVLSGVGNYFHKLSIFNNDQNGDGIFANTEGIQGLSLPVVLNLNQQPITEDKVEDALICQSKGDASNKVKIRFQFPTSYDFSSEDVVEISLVVGIANVNKQGKQFFANGECLVKPLGDDAAGSQAECTFDVPKDLPEQGAVLLFNPPVDGSSTYSLPFSLGDPCGQGVLSAVDFDAPAVTGAIGALGAPGSLPPPEPAEEKKKSESDSGIGVVSALGQDSVQSPAVGLGSLGVTGGVKGPGGCSLDPGISFDSDLLYALLIGFLFPLGTLFTLRLFYHPKKCKVHSITEGRRRKRF